MRELSFQNFPQISVNDTEGVTQWNTCFIYFNRAKVRVEIFSINAYKIRGLIIINRSITRNNRTK